MCFFFNDTATAEIYTLSLHDALPILAAIIGNAAIDGAIVGWLRLPWTPLALLVQAGLTLWAVGRADAANAVGLRLVLGSTDRKSTRLNSSHANISYAVFCLKKKSYTL